MLRYKLRTLVIVLALLPPVLALCWFGVGEFVRRQNELRSSAAPRPVQTPPAMNDLDPWYQLPPSSHEELFDNFEQVKES